MSLFIVVFRVTQQGLFLFHKYFHFFSE